MRPVNESRIALGETLLDQAEMYRDVAAGRKRVLNLEIFYPEAGTKAHGGLRYEVPFDISFEEVVERHNDATEYFRAEGGQIVRTSFVSQEEAAIEAENWQAQLHELFTT